MRKNWIPKRVLSVILAAALTMSPTMTAVASPVDGNASEELLSEESTSKEESSKESVSEESTTEESISKESSLEESTSKESLSEDTAVSEDAKVPMFEEVDPQEEGLEIQTENVKAEEIEEKVESTDPEEETRVIIVMEGDSVLDKGYDTKDLADNNAAMKTVDDIEAKQEKEAEKISYEALDGEPLDINYSFSILTNAISADVAYGDIKEIEKVDGVSAVYIAKEHEPMTEAKPETITSGDMVGSYNTWSNGYTGAGMRIAVIDTGIDIDHRSFDGDAFEAHLEETAEKAGKKVADYDLLDEEEIANVLPQLNAYKKMSSVTAEELYNNEKVAYAFNYVDKNLDITHDNDIQGDHGTHVSGISTANLYVKNAASETGYSKQESGVVGIAPDAQLISMKVFGTNGGAYTDDYMAGIEDAILLKADTINLSLGSSSAGESSEIEDYINEIFNKLEGTSTVVSISAGNSGRWGDETVYGVNKTANVNQDTVGSPGSYMNALTVASAVNSGLTYYYIGTEDGKHIAFMDGSEANTPFFYQLDNDEGTAGTEYPFVYLSGMGEASDYEGLDVKGKIVLVSRGAITFGEKHMNAEAAGAIGVLIYNNQPGTISMSLSGSTATIPCASITQADGQAIANIGKKVSEGVYEGTLRVYHVPETIREAADGYTMSDFSSIGVPGSLDLKPEITAPGGNVFSTTDNSCYGTMSGTSMAAPSIAGQSALLQQYIKENDLASKNDISIRTLAQSLLMSTASPLFEKNDKTGVEYSPRLQGAGLANVEDAISSPAYILVGDKDGNDGKVKAVLGDDPSKSGNYSFDFDIYNMDDEPHYYALDASVLTEQVYSEDGISYFKGTAHKLNPSVELTAENTKLLYDLNEDGKVDKKDRKLLLKIANGSADLPIVNDNFDKFDFNSDGVIDTKDVYALNKQLKGGEAVADLSCKVVEVSDSTKVNVNINLSNADREYLSAFENGMYVDGFVYVNGAVSMSVPFLAFYGSWIDSPMFEDYDFGEAWHNEEYAKSATTYTGAARTNFLSYYPLGSENENYYVSNYFTEDEEYIADRNALSSNSMLGSQYFSLIRNASRFITTISDRNTGEKYFEQIDKNKEAAFYVASKGRWYNDVDNVVLDWKGTDANGNALPDGTEVEVSVLAIPAYYDDVEDVESLKSDSTYFSTPITIDNTKPVLTDAVKGENGKYDLTVYDNRYTASVLVIDKDKSTILASYSVNQDTKDKDMVVSIDAPEDVFYVQVVDYALNSSVYRFNNTGHADTKLVSELSVDKDDVTVEVNDSVKVNATVGPNWLAEGYDEVVWSSEDESVATVKDGTIYGVSEGSTTVTVTTVAKDKKGNNLKASVKVTVVGSTEENDETNKSEKEDKLKEKSSEKEADVLKDEVNEGKSLVKEEVKEDTETENIEAEETSKEESGEAKKDSSAESEASENNVSEEEASTSEVTEDHLGGENDD